jgi:Flp pilus assembly protein TadG
MHSAAILLRRLWRDCSAATALEFALTGPIFLLFAMMIFENGLLFFTQELLDNATRDAARQIRIGSPTLVASSSAVKSYICGEAGVVIPSCTSKIHLYIAVAASGTPAGTGFTTLNAASDSGGNIVEAFPALGTGQDVLMQVGYARSNLFTWLTHIAGGGGDLLVSTVAFQNEPY